MMEKDDELAELERRMRRKLFLDGPSSRGDKLTEEEQRIAEKLMGRDNAERRQNWRGDRPFRPKPVLVHYETYERPGDAYLCGGMEINRIENGRCLGHRWQEMDFDAEVARLRKEGFEVRHVMTEREKFEAAQTKRRLDTPPQQQPRRPQERHSKRRAFLEQLRGFKL